MLTGRIPYKTDTDSDFQIMKEIVEVNLISPNLLNPNLSSRVCDAIKQMTEKDRTKRFATCFLISEYLEGNQENIKKYGNLPILKTKDKETSKSIYIQEPLNANQIIDFNKMDFNKINSNNIGENKPKEAIETKEFKKRLKLRKQIYIYIIIFLMILLIYFSLIR
jgi:serine/threonine protein kinase